MRKERGGTICATFELPLCVNAAAYLQAQIDILRERAEQENARQRESETIKTEDK